ncbi:site-specific tyrosine recombinase XerD [Streptococcus hongkongensis]|nr:recombinase XerD [Streptococcus uberis]
MIEHIDLFLDQKSISQNTKLSYRYDLLQFVEVIGDRLSQDKLKLYRESLSSLSPAAKKRKYSAVNQFLLFLYQHKLVMDYYFLDDKIRVEVDSDSPKIRVNPELFYQATAFESGQLIALLTLEMGLFPNEIAQLSHQSIDLSFDVIRVTHKKRVRVLTIPKKVIPILEKQLISHHNFLFEHGGKPFSRQWYFSQLKSFLESIGYGQLSAQDLRTEFILTQKEKGKSLMELSKELGLKSPITLEKYYKN